MRLPAPVRLLVVFVFALILLTTAAVAGTQFGIRGQIFLPNGSPVQRVMRFQLTTNNGGRTEYFYTDSNGRIALPQINSNYSITIESDGQTFDTTTVTFIPPTSGNYIVVHLRPRSSDATPAPGIVDINAVDQRVSPKAKEEYDAALKLLQAGEYEKAIEPLKKAISIQRDYFHAYNDLGVLYMKLKQLDPAVEALQKAIKINDKVYLPQLNLGIVLNRQGKHREALDVLTKLQTRYPDLWKIHAPMVEALIGSGEWARAEEAITRALNIKDIDVVDMKTKLGMVMIRQGKYAAAVEVLREAVGGEPDNAQAQFNLGAALMQTGKLDESEAALERASKIEGSKMPGAVLLLGQVYFQKKDYAKAIDSFETYLKYLPDAPNAAQVKEAIAKLRQAIAK
jgi:tetratricopeptide (TPR) repeat protein